MKKPVNIIQRVRFPPTVDVASLYIKCKIGGFHPDDERISLRRDDVVSFNTYFNSFYERFYAKYTTLRSVYYLLNLEGEFQILVYRDFYGKERELIATYESKICQKSSDVKIPLPDLGKNTDENSGRIYLELVCTSQKGMFRGGYVATDQPQCNKVSLGIIICTFRKEEYLRKTLTTIRQDDFLQNKNLEIFVVDNGNTLHNADFQDNRVKVIAHRNVGGSGGFSRGLIKVLQEGNCTHFLLMDDDIELESESIYRLFPLYEYTKSAVVIAGSMLDLYKKQVLYEAGAIYGKTPERRETLFKSIPLKHKLELADPYELNRLLIEEDIDYGGFWFFSFSKEIVSKIGLLMPFFIKVDDMEFGVRIRESFGNRIIAFPAIAVWHEPFYAKAPLWDVYYYTRNALITNAIHDISTCFQTVKTATKTFLFYIFRFDYNCAEIFLRAFEDYIHGPTWMAKTDPEKLHTKIRACASKYHNHIPMSSEHLPYKQFHSIPSVRKFGKLCRLITLNGHLLPDFLILNERAYILPGERDQWYKTYRRNSVIVRRYTGLSQYTLDKATGRKLFLKWVKMIITMSMRWLRVRAEWKHSLKDMTSIKFWEKYLSLARTITR